MRIAILEENEGVYSVLSYGTTKELFPNVSFRRGVAPNQEFLDDNDAVIIDEQWQPTIDTTTQYTRRVDPYVLSDRTVVSIGAIDYTPEQLLEKARLPYFDINYSEFWQELIRSSVYSTLKDAARVDLVANVLATELISIFSDAKSGNLDIEALQVAIWETVGALNSIDPNLVTSLSSIMTTHGLQIYSLTPPAQ